LNFKRIEKEYRRLNPAGGIEERVKAGWDLDKNAPI
jgi:hypothetical protein